MPNSHLHLPGNFQPGKSYAIKGKTLIAWRDSLLADRIVVGPGLKESQTPQGRILIATAQGGTAAACTELVPKLKQDGSSWSVSVSDGLIGSITPEIGGVLLNAVTPPTISLSSAGALYLKSTYTMNSSSYLDDGTTKYYRSETEGTIDKVEFVYLTTPPSDTLPEVNETSGASTSGVSYVTWLSVLDDGNGGFKEGASRRCNRMFYFCGTLKLYQG